MSEPGSARWDRDVGSHRARWVRTAIVPLVVVAVGGAAWALAPVPVPVLAGDAPEYLQLTRNLAALNGYSLADAPPFEPTAFRGPGYPLFLLAATLGLHLPLAAVAVAQILLQAAMAWAVACAVRSTTASALWGVGAGLLAGLYPTVVRYNLILLTEGLATSLVTLAGVMSWRLLVAEDRSPAREGSTGWLGVGLLLGFSSLVRSEMVAFAAAFLLVPWFGSRRSRSRWGAVLLLGLGTAALVGPWATRNYMVTGRLTLTTDLSEQVPVGYMHWLITWMDHPRYVQAIAWDVASFGRYDPSAFPPNAFVSEAERDRVHGLLSSTRGSALVGSPADSAFEELARERRRHKPLQVFLTTPLLRVVRSWAYLPTAGVYRPWYAKGRPPADIIEAASPRHWPQVLLILLSLALLGLGTLGALLSLGPSGRVLLPFTVLLLGRIALLWVAHPEPRYSLEAIPSAVVLACWCVCLLFARVRGPSAIP